VTCQNGRVGDFATTSWQYKVGRTGRNLDEIIVGVKFKKKRKEEIREEGWRRDSREEGLFELGTGWDRLVPENPDTAIVSLVS